MIPKAKLWLARLLDEEGIEIRRCLVKAPTKFLATLNMRHGTGDLPACIFNMDGSPYSFEQSLAFQRVWLTSYGVVKLSAYRRKEAQL